MHIGTVAALWRYPVKSLACEPLIELGVEADGFAGDRRSALIVASPDHARAGKPYRGKEHNRLHLVRATGDAQAAGAAAGVMLNVVAGERYFDAGAVSLLFDRWLHDVEALAGRALDPLRYRPNIFAAAAPDFTGREAELVDAELALGSTLLRVTATIKRCVTTTYDVATGEPDPRVLAVVANQRANVVGVYCTVVRPGTIACGDSIARR